MARNYTISERAIIYTAIAGGATRDEINTILMSEQQRLRQSVRLLPEASYKMVKDKYLPKLGKSTLWKQISRPKPINGLDQAKK